MNDGSDDNSLEIINEYRKKYPALIIIVNQDNQGVSSARNRGIEIARGEYIAFIDSDDFVKPNYINSILQNARFNNADIVQTGYVDVWTNKEGFESHTRKDMVFNAEDSSKFYEQISGFVWAGVFRKRLFENLRFAEKFWNEDMITRFLIARRANCISIMSNCLYCYTYHPDSLSHLESNKYMIKSVDQAVLAVKMFEYGKSHLHLPTDSKGYSILLKELSCMTYDRTQHLPAKIRQYIFTFLSAYIQKLNSTIPLLETKLYTIEKAFKDGNYALWKNYCRYLYFYKKCGEILSEI